MASAAQTFVARGCHMTRAAIAQALNCVPARLPESSYRSVCDGDEHVLQPLLDELNTFKRIEFTDNDKRLTDNRCRWYIETVLDATTNILNCWRFEIGSRGVTRLQAAKLMLLIHLHAQEQMAADGPVFCLMHGSKTLQQLARKELHFLNKQKVRPKKKPNPPIPVE